MWASFMMCNKPGHAIPILTPAALCDPLWCCAPHLLHFDNLGKRIESVDTLDAHLDAVVHIDCTVDLV
ncbi:hypothetical protein EWM64_g9661 [Hericium alpestre]|uniref:Uncharacterized protein n=1 Tax=Hericium alpestre TaxID=135208 RepID=A0A4Y9ZJJ2_9AGAM|nr:hypothetical protein EWM64_g9661 [Hericium alpestre]